MGTDMGWVLRGGLEDYNALGVGTWLTLLER